MSRLLGFCYFKMLGTLRMCTEDPGIKLLICSLFSAQRPLSQTLQSYTTQNSRPLGTPLFSTFLSSSITSPALNFSASVFVGMEKPI